MAVLIHLRTLGTLVYTPGYPGLAHPTPKETTPNWRPVDVDTAGPPESPCE